MALVRCGFVLLVWLGIFLGAGATLAGALAAALPYFELINHFRPFLIIILFGLLAAAWPTGHAARAAAGLVLTANLALASAPLAFTARSASHPTLRITTFNVWVGNPTPDAVVEFLKSNDADVILLQEVDPSLEAKLIPPLQSAYPHIVSCARRNCGLVLLSKTPWLMSGSLDRTPAAPPLVWATYADPGGNRTITGVHLAYPFQPIWQVDQVDWLSRRLSGATGTQIVAGDFNLSPFSWKLNKLTAEARLLRHATLGASWPAHRLTPFVLLDNLLASPNVRSTVSYGPDQLGPDHRPLTFDLSLD